MRHEIHFYINKDLHKVSGEELFLTLSTYLRQKCYLTGTKVVCAEGDCGACTVLHHFPKKDQKSAFLAVNSCILPLFLLDGSHIVTVEGLVREGGIPSAAQESMAQNYGAQCGYCTPGFVMSLTQLGLDKEQAPQTQEVKDYLTGNLCRCTGYKGIIDSGLRLDPKAVKEDFSPYYNSSFADYLLKIQQESFYGETSELKMWSPTSFQEALQIKKEHPHAVIIGSGTDLGVLINKGKLSLREVISLHLIPECYEMTQEENLLVVGAKVTLTDLEKKVKDLVPQWADLLHIFASPQIKNVGTLVGNVANASPVGDNLPPLLVMNALVELESLKGRRLVPLDSFYLGYKKMDKTPDEIIRAIHIPLPVKGEKEDFIRFYKVSKRKDLDISTVSAAFKMRLDEEHTLCSCSIAFGGIAATPVRLKELEDFMRGKKYSATLLEESIGKLLSLVRPLSDVRGSATYRTMLVENLFRKYFMEWGI